MHSAATECYYQSTSTLTKTDPFMLIEIEPWDAQLVVRAWLPKVHIAIGNLKAFLNGTFHGVSHRYLQEYLDEFCYRYNRRFWEPELPHRLLNACLTHAPVTS